MDRRTFIAGLALAAPASLLGKSGSVAASVTTLVDIRNPYGTQHVLSANAPSNGIGFANRQFTLPAGFGDVDLLDGMVVCGAASVPVTDLSKLALGAVIAIIDSLGNLIDYTHPAPFLTELGNNYWGARFNPSYRIRVRQSDVLLIHGAILDVGSAPTLTTSLMIRVDKSLVV